MFNKVNFIVPISTDIILKIRNNIGAIVYLIRNPSCTLSITDSSIYIKQNAESETIILKFSNSVEARGAHILLRDALLMLQNNINNSNTPTALNILRVNIFPLITTTIGINHTMIIPVQINDISYITVNGIIIDLDDYSFNINALTLTWLGTAPYILEPDDLLTIFYV
jgi:hypothetical protein